MTDNYTGHFSTQPLHFVRKSESLSTKANRNRGIIKNVILVSLDWRRPEDGKTSLGIASIAAALSAEGGEVTLIEETVNDEAFCVDKVFTRLINEIANADSESLVGFGVYVWNDKEVCELIRRLKLNSSSTIVLGGPQITYMHKGGLEQAYPKADYFVRGQGEIPMVELARGDPQPISGVHKPGNTDNGAQAEFQLEKLPSPFLNGWVKLEPNIRWETQRGCPFKCSFCQHREPGNRLRSHWIGTGRLEEEVELFANAEVKRISILDPIFHTNQDRAIKRLESIKKNNLDAQLSLQCRFEMITPEFLDALDGINATLEFGVQTIIPAECKVIGRPNNMKKIEQVVKELKARNIDYEVSLIYGLPLQTLDSFEESINWCRSHGIPRIQAWPLMLLRGTPIYSQRETYGFKESKDNAIPIVIASNSFTELDHLKMSELADAL